MGLALKVQLHCTVKPHCIKFVGAQCNCNHLQRSLNTNVVRNHLDQYETVAVIQFTNDRRETNCYVLLCNTQCAYKHYYVFMSIILNLNTMRLQ